MPFITTSVGGDGSGLQGPQGDPGADFGIYYLGNYNPSSGYVPDIAVVRGSDGQLYLAKASGQLNDPVGNTAQWEVWIPKGADGTDVFAEDGTLYGPTNFGGLKVLGLINSGENDLALQANDADIYLQASSGAVTIAAPEVTITSNASPSSLNINTYSGAIVNSHRTSTYSDENKVVATLGDIQNTGDITFDGVKIIGAGTASGDGYDLGTIELVPDGDINTDQYVIIDPTSPNHIHLRAGGVQDNSSAHIFLGGERNNIEVSDPYRTVKINTKPDGAENTYANLNGASNAEFVHVSTGDIQSGDTVRLYTGGPTYVVDNVTQEYPSEGFITVTAPGLSFIAGEAYVFTRDQGSTNQWTFENNGVLSGPAMGAVRVNSLLGNSEDTLVIANTTKIVLDGGYGEFLNDESANNQIATIGDLPTGATGTFISQDNKTITVDNGIITSIV